MRTGVVTGNSHRPTAVAPTQIGEKFCRVIDVLRGVQHGSQIIEFTPVVIMIDLHAAKIDELLPAGPGAVKGPQRCRDIRCKNRLALDVQGVGMQRPLATGLGKANRIQNADRHTMPFGGGGDLPFT